MSSKRRVRLAAVGDVAEGEGRVIETQGKELATTCAPTGAVRSARASSMAGS